MLVISKISRWFVSVINSNKTGEEAMRGFGTERPKTVFAKIVLVFLLFVSRSDIYQGMAA